MKYPGILIGLFSVLSLSGFSQNFDVDTIQELGFGMFAMGSSSATITVSANSVITGTQGIIILGSNAQAARFRVSTTSVIPVNITISADDIYLVNQFNQTLLLSPDIIVPQSILITPLNPAFVSVGGSLYIPGDFPGYYTGTLQVHFTINNQ